MSTAAITKKERYFLAVKGQEVDHPPVWIMRQAGRYMPEYRALRQEHSFLDFCHKPEISAAATLLPLELLGVDLLIIFNDILIPLAAMGRPAAFPEGGPVIERPVRSDVDLDDFTPSIFDNPDVAKSLRLVREKAGPDVPILGFCGSPFTLALYAVEGNVSRNHDESARLLYARPALFEEILRRLTDTAVNYLIAQVEQGGADGVQVFESWGGGLPRHLYERFAAPFQKDLIQRFKAACPGVPVHLFVRWTEGKIPSMEATGADVLSIDWMMPLAQARAQTACCLQGNLDPMAMLAPEAVERQVAAMIEGFDWRHGWIANLGHGITPQADPRAARRFVDAVHALPTR